MVYFQFVRGVVDNCSDVSEEYTASIFQVNWYSEMLERLSSTQHSNQNKILKCLTGHPENKILKCLTGHPEYLTHKLSFTVPIYAQSIQFKSIKISY